MFKTHNREKMPAVLLRQGAYTERATTVTVERRHRCLAQLRKEVTQTHSKDIA
jgi:hypothetical protein